MRYIQSRTMRHPHYETARDRDREQAEEELARDLAVFAKRRAAAANVRTVHLSEPLPLYP